MTAKREIAEFCIHESERIANTDGFVPIRRLLDRFQADIVLRPLLVEAMLASVKSPITPAKTSDTLSWIVLVDSERYPLPPNAIERETSDSPLSSRLRNTVAHELIHSLSFRPKAFNFKFHRTKKSAHSHADFIRQIERETEAFSPLLLIPYSQLIRLSEQPEMKIEDVCDLRSRCAVSRDVLIARLNLLTQFDPNSIRIKSCLENAAVGKGEWLNSTTARIHGWPLYVNFANANTPEFFRRMNRSTGMLASEIISDPHFYLNGGDHSAAEVSINDQPGMLPHRKMNVKVAVERVPREANSQFLFSVTRVIDTSNPVRQSIDAQAANPTVQGQLL